MTGARESRARQPSEIEAVMHAFQDHQDDVEEVVKADDWLRGKGYALSPESRTAFLAVLEERYLDALVLLARRSRGDFGRDPVLDILPPETDAPTGRATEARPRLSGKPVPPWPTFEAWVAAKQPAQGTVTRWRGVWLKAKKQWPDLRSVTEQDARDWFREQVLPDSSPKTARDVGSGQCAP